MSRIVFIRHAQASYMADDYDQLSDLGKQQSEALGRFIDREQITFDKIYIGPLKRHYQTLEHCSKMAPSSMPVESTILEGLKEHNGPEALKIKYHELDDLYNQVAEWKQQIADEPAEKKRYSLRIFRLFMKEWMAGNIIVDHPSVVPFTQWLLEVKHSLGHILSEVEPGDTVGVITSGGTKGAIIAHALGIEDGRKIANLNDSIRNTAMSHFNYSNLGFNVLSFNEIPHLSRDQITFV